MRITPLDVKKQDFRKSVRGFDCEEVRAFLTTLADEYETVLVDNKQIRERIMEQDDKIAEYKTMERTLRDTLMTAERLMQETRETAGREGDVIILAAQQKAKGILQECRMRTEELRREIVGLRKEKETYLARFKGLAEAQISFIEAHKNDFADLDKRLVDLVDSVVDGALNSEAEARFPAQAPSTPKAYHQPASPTAAQPYQAPAQAPVEHRSQEVDMWRDYNPGVDSANNSSGHSPSHSPSHSSGNTESNWTGHSPANDTSAHGHGPAWVGPEASPAATTSEPEAVVNDVISETKVANVELAALGIPVPAVKAAGETGSNDPTDAITEAISATLNENPHPQAVKNW